MRRTTLLALLPLSAALGLSGCGSPPSTVVVTPTRPAQPQVAVVSPPPAPSPYGTVAPTPPPPPESQLVPEPPAAGGTVVWQPGHWAYTGAAGSPWTWINGQYVPAPPGMTSWVPGQWLQQANGTWRWAPGHWA